MRSIHPNLNANLEYPYFISETEPLELQIHIHADKKYATADRGFVYILDASGFKNDPEGSWQFVKEGAVPFSATVETEAGDFQYPAKIIRDL
jgi:hypothetical protein